MLSVGERGCQFVASHLSRCLLNGESALEAKYGRNVRPHYRYESLSGDQIRLLEPQAGANDDPLECVIHTASLSANPWYEALSYCWGTGSQSEQLNYGVEAFPGLQHEEKIASRTHGVKGAPASNRMLIRMRYRRRAAVDVGAVSQRYIVSLCHCAIGVLPFGLVVHRNTSIW
jgi:hypothetical protein